MPEIDLETSPAPFPRLARRTVEPDGLTDGAAKPPPWAALLGHFYARANLSLPRIVRLEARQLPPLCRRLLAHNNDMTPTLEQFHGEALALQVCSRECTPDAYLREVVLTLAGSGRPVEYGAIRIHLARFAERVRRLIVEEHHPFGRILEMEAIPHLGWPQAYFRVDPDGHMKHLLKFQGAHPFYGRRNVLLDGQRRLLAEVIEILAPAQSAANPT
jgi:chorismate-pyruvate lyase